jgi:hypothetical protein
MVVREATSGSVFSRAAYTSCNNTSKIAKIGGSYLEQHFDLVLFKDVTPSDTRPDYMGKRRTIQD